MNNTTSSFISGFNKTVENCAVFLCITRDSQLQKTAIIQLLQLLKDLSDEKDKAKASGDEDYANLLLGCECIANGQIAEIKMWLLLKEDKPDEAWDALITAQDSFLAATRAHNGFTGLEGHIRRLAEIECLVFPPQVFLSSGMIVESQICSICADEYDDCGHVKGRPYMGEFCTVRLIPSKIDHVSIVKEPANKRCRVTSFSDEGGDRNRMTWVVKPKENANKESVQASKVEAILAVSAPSSESTKEDIIFVD